MSTTARPRHDRPRWVVPTVAVVVATIIWVATTSWRPALTWALGIVVFLGVLSLSVGIHEASHMAVAKAMRLSVPRYFIGFGPKMWSTHRHGTEYGVRWLPLGGYVSIEDDTQPDKSLSRTSLSHVAPWKRLLIFGAGPVSNLVVGVAMLMVFYLVVPVTIGTTTVASVNSCAPHDTCGASLAGMKAGDRIVAIDGTPVAEFSQIREALPQSGSVPVVVSRDGRDVTLQVTLDDQMMGVTMRTTTSHLGWTKSWQSTWGMLSLNAQAIKSLPSSTVTAARSVTTGAGRGDNAPASVVEAGKVYGQTVSQSGADTSSKVQMLLGYTAMLNIGLGIMNLIPFLILLDGGRMAVACVDQVRLWMSKMRRTTYSPLNDRAVGWAVIGSGVVLAFFVLTLVAADIAGIARGQL